MLRAVIASLLTGGVVKFFAGTTSDGSEVLTRAERQPHWTRHAWVKFFTDSTPAHDRPGAANHWFEHYMMMIGVNGLCSVYDTRPCAKDRIMCCAPAAQPAPCSAAA